MKKLISFILIFALTLQPVYAQLIQVDKLSGLSRQKADKMEDGFHAKFNNLYIKDGNIQVVKGRNRLNSTALTNTTTNGFWYYENAAGTTKKLVRMENTVLASYDVDGTNRTQLNTGLTNEAHDAVQIGDTLYITSATDGLYRWTGSGAATAITGVSAPASVNFAATTGEGGLTPGQPISVAPNLTASGACANSPSTTATGCIWLGSSPDTGGTSVSSDNGTLETAGTSTTYKYKVTSYSSVWGIESEASSSDDATLSGDSLFTWSGTSCNACDTDSPYSDWNAACCSDIQYVTHGRETRTTGTLAAAPSAPFDGYRIYRTVAGGSDYFLLGYQTTGAYTDGKPDASLGPALDTTIDTITPPSYKYIESYQGVIFLGEASTLQFNRLPVSAVSSADTYWLESDKISLGTESSVTGIHATSNALLAFTDKSVLELSGFGARSFRLNKILDGVGTVSDATIETDNNGDVIFFAGVQGVYKLTVNRKPSDNLLGSIINTNDNKSIRISSPVLDEVFKGTDSQIDLDPSDYTSAHAYFDKDNGFYILFIGSHSFIFNTLNESWSYVPATKMGASLYRKSPNAAGQGVMVDTLGFFYNNWIGYENGIESGTVTGTTTSSTSTTLTDSGATFNTTNAGLTGLWVYLDNENGEYRQITSNTGTQLTVSPAWTTNPIAGDVYYIAYIIPELETKQYTFSKPPQETITNSFWVVHNLSDSTQDVEVYGYMDKSTTPETILTLDFNDSRVTKFSKPLRATWLQYGLRSFVYNTSDTINPPIDISAYVVDADIRSER